MTLLVPQGVSAFTIYNFSEILNHCSYFPFKQQMCVHTNLPLTDTFVSLTTAEWLTVCMDSGSDTFIFSLHRTGYVNSYFTVQWVRYISYWQYRRLFEVSGHLCKNSHSSAVKRPARFINVCSWSFLKNSGLQYNCDCSIIINVKVSNDYMWGTNWD